MTPPMPRSMSRRMFGVTVVPSNPTQNILAAARSMSLMSRKLPRWLLEANLARGLWFCYLTTSHVHQHSAPPRRPLGHLPRTRPHADGRRLRLSPAARHRSEKLDSPAD